MLVPDIEYVTVGPKPNQYTVFTKNTDGRGPFLRNKEVILELSHPLLPLAQLERPSQEMVGMQVHC